jgi:hypothetical protein
LQEMNVGRLKSRRKALVATLALVAAMAIGAVGASGAQALTWHHNGGTVLSGTESETVASSEGTFNVKTTFLGGQVQFGCTATSTGSIAAAGGGSSSLSLSKCSVSKPAHCEVVPLAPLSAHIALAQVGGGLYQKFTGAREGSSFANIEFAGPECTISGSPAPLKGSFAGRELTSGQSVNRALSFTKGEGEAWPEVEMKFGGSLATATGSMTQHLSGLLEGGKWQGSSKGWEVEPGVAFGVTELLSTLGGSTKFSFTIAGSPVSFTCSGQSIKSATLIPGGTESIEGLTYSGCKFEKPAACELPGGNLSFAPVTGTLMRVNGKTYERFTPVGSNFATVTIEGACGIAGTGKSLTGSIAALIPESGVVETVHSLEFSTAADEATGSQLMLGTSAGHATGSVQQNLSKATPWDVFL